MIFVKIVAMMAYEIINYTEIEIISKGIVPEGTLIFTISPTFFADKTLGNRRTDSDFT